jgi:hypothetical protein
MNLIWSLICERAVVDQNSNAISLINVLEALKVSRPQKSSEEKGSGIVIPIVFYIVSFWLVDERSRHEEREIKIEIWGPTKKIKEFSNDFIAPDKIKRVRLCMVMNGLPIDGEGEYRFKIFIRKKEQEKYLLASEIPLDVSFQN